MKKLTSTQLIILVSVFLILVGNFTFFTNVLEVYPPESKNILFLLSLPVVFASVNAFLLSLVCFRYTIKPVLIIVLLLSSSTAYFMDAFHVIIDDTMIENIVRTDIAEASDLITTRHLLYIFFLGVLPSVFVYRTNIEYLPRKRAFISRIKLTGLSVALAVSAMFVLGAFYASFFREHKVLRFYANPSYYLYSAVKYTGTFVSIRPAPFQDIGLDARIPATDEDRELVILVVGEAVRTDHLSLNGYSKKTTPLLEKRNIINFRNVWSCGTSTAVSVPCMFSIYDRSDYSKEKATATGNVLDVLQHAGVNVIWLDNNSDSKGVAARVPFESFKSAAKNPVCDSECRDVGMLSGLQDYIDAHPQGDIFIVLHQMGNHGPAYYKRYPKQFEKFTPTCETNQLEQCSREEISNAYDNAILYTDYFLSRVIDLLDSNSDVFESAMIYISDHGESLGEGNLYLHGLPYMIAPDAQKRVPMIMWFSDSFDRDEIDPGKLKERIDKKYSHDNLFHTILGLMEIESTVYDEAMDITGNKDGH